MSIRRYLTHTVAALTLAGGVLAASPASAAASGVNDWGCQPQADKLPIVLVHGLGATKESNWAVHGPRLAREGYCVFSLTYGTTSLGPWVGGLASMRDSSAEVAAFIDRVLTETGAAKVHYVGHSEGTTVGAYYIKYDGGRDTVDTFVGFGSNFDGSTLGGLNILINALRGTLPGTADEFRKRCAACLEYIKPSDFLDDLAEGGLTVPEVRYTSIISRLDTIVVPYTSGRLPDGPNVRNVVLQDRCPLDLAGHLAMAIDPNVGNAIIEALEPGRTLRCSPFIAPL